jgi:hypothetical protein
MKESSRFAPSGIHGLNRTTVSALSQSISRQPLSRSSNPNPFRAAAERAPSRSTRSKNALVHHVRHEAAARIRRVRRSDIRRMELADCMVHVRRHDNVVVDRPVRLQRRFMDQHVGLAGESIERQTQSRAFPQFAPDGFVIRARIFNEVDPLLRQGSAARSSSAVSRALKSMRMRTCGGTSMTPFSFTVSNSGSGSAPGQ